MILSAFCHIRGITYRLEKRLWESGVSDWKKALLPESKPVIEKVIGGKNIDSFLEGVRLSLENYQKRDLKALAKNLTAGDLWRLLEDFLDEALFLDIETGIDETGNQNISLIGTYRISDGYRCFFYGENREDFPQYFEKAEVVVTFNGSRFDIPVIKRTFPGISEPKLHVDLLWIIRKAGMKGSLKKIEMQFGIEREPEIRGLDGLDALKLWSRWFLEKDFSARQLLMEYNKADTVNLLKVSEKLLVLLKTSL